MSAVTIANIEKIKHFLTLTVKLFDTKLFTNVN